MNLAVDEQEFLREAARGALSRVKTIEAAREALEGSDPARPVADRGRGRLARAADRRGPRRRRPRASSTPCSWPQECGRVLARAPLLGAAAGQRAARRPPATKRSRRWRRAMCARRGCPRGRPATSSRAGPSTRARQASPARAACDGRRRPRERHRRGRLGARRSRGRPAGRGRASTSTAPRSRAPSRRRAASIEAVTRYDATRSLGHVTLDGARRPAPAGHRRAAGAGVVPGPGAAGRRVAGRGGDRAGDGRAVRQGALHLRPRHRLLPGDQARAHRGPAPPGERALAAVLRRLGLRGPPEEFALAASAARSAAGSALDFASRQNIVTARRDRRDLGARRPAVLPPRPARAGGCSAARATPPTAWRRSCSRRPDASRASTRPERRSPGSAAQPRAGRRAGGSGRRPRARPSRRAAASRCDSARRPTATAGAGPRCPTRFAPDT